MESRIAVCIFAKPPRTGEAKTRLIPALGAEGAAVLARAFLEDTWEQVRGLTWAVPVLTSPSPWSTEALAGAPEAWPQGSGDLGARMESVIHRALAGHPGVIALGADCPGLPCGHVESLRSKMQAAEAVFGPSEDGGFYALGLSRLPRGAFAELPWSQPETLARTRERLESLGLTVSQGEPYFDVDRPADLDRLCAALRAGLVVAPRTRTALVALGRLPR
ncbi:MAG TPA: TIGR04282 family arsenosugar biosynthesis glycosyltransferase [Myxococcaceae bacterium]|nr:TIGR04282 family arsenosugar biosynthesis glycosyltransferase [Myxococcaceae bacterium]